MRRAILSDIHAGRRASSNREILSMIEPATMVFPIGTQVLVLPMSHPGDGFIGHRGTVTSYDETTDEYRVYVGQFRGLLLVRSHQLVPIDIESDESRTKFTLYFQSTTLDDAAEIRGSFVLATGERGWFEFTKQPIAAPHYHLRLAAQIGHTGDGSLIYHVPLEQRLDEAFVRSAFSEIFDNASHVPRDENDMESCTEYEVPSTQHAGEETSSPRVSTNIPIRPATPDDWPAIWAMFREVTAAGDSFAYDSDTSEEVARKLWFELPARCWVAQNEQGEVIGTYYVRPNQPGRGATVANAGYMVAASARRRGLASQLCEHSLQSARELGYLAMQFNFVVGTNTAAIRTWEKHGFQIVGRLPQAFRHATLGLVEALVMWRAL